MQGYSAKVVGGVTFSEAIKEILMNRTCVTKKAFTLVELLVVISIIALLLSILMPSLSKARDSAKDAICKSNCRSMGIICQAYAAGNNGYFPAHTNGWPSMVVDYWNPVNSRR